MAKLITTDNQIVDVFPKNGTDFKYNELNKFVNGYIEIVSMGNGAIMVVNETGKLDNLPFNAIATQLYGRDIICGNALICGEEEVK